MTDDKKLRLCYKIDGKEKELGFKYRKNTLDINSKYCLGIPLFWTPDAYEIIE